MRNLAEFFCKGVTKFRSAPGTAVRREEERDNIYAIDFCTEVKWKPALLERDTKLRRAIDKTLSHMTYSRDLRGSQLDIAFDGRFHAHGTAKLRLQTWRNFRLAMRADLGDALDEWISRHATGLEIAVDKTLRKFEERANARGPRRGVASE